MEERLKPFSLARLSIEESLKRAMDAGAYPHAPSLGVADDGAAADGTRVRWRERTAEGGCPHMLCSRGAIGRMARWRGAEPQGGWSRTDAYDRPFVTIRREILCLTSNSREESPRDSVSGRKEV